MPKYLVRASYSAEGAKGLLKEGGTTRKAAIEQVIASAGGTVETLYFALGDDDVIIIADLPDNASVTAASLTAAAAGTGSIRTTVLLTPEEVDEASKKSLTYRPPGG